MLSLLRAKFTLETEMTQFLVATSGKNTAEAGTIKNFASGLLLSHPKIFNKRAWLGHCLTYHK